MQVCPMVVDCDPYHSAYGSHATRVVACSQATPWSRSDDGVLGGGGRPHRSSCSGNSAKALQCAIKLQRRAVDVRFRAVFAHRRPLEVNQPRIGAVSRRGRALDALRGAASRIGAASQHSRALTALRRSAVAHWGPFAPGRRRRIAHWRPLSAGRHRSARPDDRARRPGGAKSVATGPCLTGNT